MFEDSEEETRDFTQKRECTCKARYNKEESPTSSHDPERHYDPGVYKKKYNLNSSSRKYHRDKSKKNIRRCSKTKYTADGIGCLTHKSTGECIGEYGNLNEYFSAVGHSANIEETHPSLFCPYHLYEKDRNTDLVSYYFFIRDRPSLSTRVFNDFKMSLSKIFVGNGKIFCSRDASVSLNPRTHSEWPCCEGENSQGVDPKTEDKDYEDIPNSSFPTSSDLSESLIEDDTPYISTTIKGVRGISKSFLLDILVSSLQFCYSFDLPLCLYTHKPEILEFLFKLEKSSGVLTELVVNEAITIKLYGVERKAKRAYVEIMKLVLHCLNKEMKIQSGPVHFKQKEENGYEMVHGSRINCTMYVITKKSTRTNIPASHTPADSSASHSHTNNQLPTIPESDEEVENLIRSFNILQTLNGIKSSRVLEVMCSLPQEFPSLDLSLDNFSPALYKYNQYLTVDSLKLIYILLNQQEQVEDMLSKNDALLHTTKEKQKSTTFYDSNTYHNSNHIKSTRNNKKTSKEDTTPPHTDTYSYTPPSCRHHSTILFSSHSPLSSLLPSFSSLCHSLYKLVLDSTLDIPPVNLIVKENYTDGKTVYVGKVQDILNFLRKIHNPEEFEGKDLDMDNFNKSEEEPVHRKGVTNGLYGTVQIDTFLEMEDFLCGKKNGKLNKIMRESKCVISTMGRNTIKCSSETCYTNESDPELRILISGNIHQIIKGLELLDLEYPETLSFYLNEKYHKRIIGFGGKNIQRIMKKHGVYIKFHSNTSHSIEIDNETLTTSNESNTPNVIIKTPRKNKHSLKKMKLEILALVNEIDPPIECKTVSKLSYFEYLTDKKQIDHLHPKKLFSHITLKENHPIVPYYYIKNNSTPNQKIHEYIENSSSNKSNILKPIFIDLKNSPTLVRIYTNPPNPSYNYYTGEVITTTHWTSKKFDQFKLFKSTLFYNYEPFRSSTIKNNSKYLQDIDKVIVGFQKQKKNKDTMK